MGSESHAPPAEVGTVSGNGAAAVEVETEKSRRALLKGLGVAAAGAVVAGVLSPEEAEAHGTFHQDSNTGDPAIHGNNTDGGPGVQGDSVGGDGVSGQSEFAAGVFGNSNSGFGVIGSSNSGTGVSAFSQSGTGVFGGSGGSPGAGVAGVFGSSTGGGTGVFGVSGGSPGAIGVQAQTIGSGTALNVVGPAKFSNAGAGTIPANQNSVAVSNPAVTANSHITMTYTGNPGLTGSGTFAAVVWIQREPGSGFTARLSRRVTNATPFTYLIVEPG